MVLIKKERNEGEKGDFFCHIGYIHAVPRSSLVQYIIRHTNFFALSFSLHLELH